MATIPPRDSIMHMHVLLLYLIKFIYLGLYTHPTYICYRLNAYQLHQPQVLLALLAQLLIKGCSMEIWYFYPIFRYQIYSLIYRSHQ